jgi:hypothetical protein
MLYGALGRVGVYHVQALLKSMQAPDESAAQRLAIARKLLGQLPATNWLKRNPFVSDHLVEGDSGLHDLLLHARDCAYEVGEIASLTEAVGLRVVSFIPPARYEPASYLSDATLLKRIDGLPPLERAAFAERLAGNMKSHAFYVVRADNPITPPEPASPEAIPVWFDPDPAPLRKALKPGGVLTVSVEGVSVRFALPRLAAVIAEAIDGRRTLRDIHAAVAAKAGPLDWPAFVAQFQPLYAALHGSGKLLLRHA